MQTLKLCVTCEVLGITVLVTSLVNVNCSITLDFSQANIVVNAQHSCDKKYIEQSQGFGYWDSSVLWQSIKDITKD